MHVLKVSLFILYVLLAGFFNSGCSSKNENERLQKMITRLSDGNAGGDNKVAVQLTDTGSKVKNADVTLEHGTPREIGKGFCGDGIINGNEYCDGNAVDDPECSKLHGYAGNITCDTKCFLDISQCITPAIDHLFGGIAENCKCLCDGELCSGTCGPLVAAGSSFCRYDCENNCVCLCERRLEVHIEDCEFQCDCAIVEDGNPFCVCRMTECNALAITKPNLTATIPLR